MTLPINTNWDALVDRLGDIEVVRNPQQVEKLSKDSYYFSPLLQQQLGGYRADLVVRPASEAEVLTVAEVCGQAGVPITVRGAGTGNYGQCIPLKGGVVLDLTRLNQVLWVQPGVARVQAGARLAAIDKATRELGWELRMYPSTYRTATIGGFIAGGSGGVGSITYGQLRDRGNLQALRIITLEPSPRPLELRGDAAQPVTHAYGTNGIITELEIPLAPAYPWAELIVTFPDFLTAADFGQRLGESDGLIKKLISIFAWPVPSYFVALRPYLPEGQAAALLMVAEPSLELFEELVREYQGTITYRRSAQEASRGTPLAEFTWNHTTLHARSTDPGLTYLQTVFPYDPEQRLVRHCYEHFGDEVQMHLEYVRVGGRVCPVGLQVVRYSSPERLQDIIDYHEAQGALIANPHTPILEDGGMKQVDPVQVEFKARVDPQGLLNPGKMRGWLERAGAS